MRIAVYNEKGGSGKTTTAVAIAVGLDLPVLDLDPQATATRWLERRDQSVAMARRADANWVADCPPGITPSIAGVLSECSLIIVPVRASFPDLITMPDTIAFLRANTSAQMAFVGCDIDRRTSDEATLKETLAPHGVPMLGILAHRASYRRAGIAGKLANEVDSAAKAEIAELIKKIRELL